MSKYLYAVICRSKNCLWNDPDFELAHAGTLAEARKIYREMEKETCGCGEEGNNSIVRRPVKVWEEVE